MLACLCRFLFSTPFILLRRESQSQSQKYANKSALACSPLYKGIMYVKQNLQQSFLTTGVGEYHHREFCDKLQAWWITKSIDLFGGGKEARDLVLMDVTRVFTRIIDPPNPISGFLDLYSVDWLLKSPVK